jgi:hypothetical protein
MSGAITIIKRFSSSHTIGKVAVVKQPNQAPRPLVAPGYSRQILNCALLASRCFVCITPAQEI